MLTLTATLFEGNVNSVTQEPETWLTRSLVLVGKDLVDDSRYENAEISLNLRGRRLEYANLTDSDLHNADLIGARLQGATLRHADFREAELRCSSIPMVAENCTQIQGADLSFAHLQGANLSGARMIGANLSAADLRGAILDGTRLDAAVLDEADLQGARLDHANLTAANVENAVLRGATLTWASLWHTTFVGTQLSAADLSWSHLQATRVAYTDMRLVNLAHVYTSPYTKPSDVELEETSSKIYNRSHFLRLMHLYGIYEDVKKYPPLTGSPSKSQDVLVYGGASDEIERLFNKHVVSDAYWPKLTEFLAALACGDEWVAKGIARRISGPFAKPYAKPVAARLLDPICEGGKALPEGTRAELRRLIETPPASAPARPAAASP
jgi:uncharacterized protein YjbI with pentapeptide repeats